MPKATLQQRLLYDGIKSINAVVELLSFEEAHETLRRLQQHLRARLGQTRTDQTARKQMKRTR